MGMLEVRIKNGRPVKGSVEDWIASIVQNLPPEMATRVFKSVENKIVAYQRPGSHVLHAEPIELGAQITSLGGDK